MLLLWLTVKRGSTGVANPEDEETPRYLRLATGVQNTIIPPFSCYLFYIRSHIVLFRWELWQSVQFSSDIHSMVFVSPLPTASICWSSHKYCLSTRLLVYRVKHAVRGERVKRMPGQLIFNCCRTDYRKLTWYHGKTSTSEYVKGHHCWHCNYSLNRKGFQSKGREPHRHHLIGPFIILIC